MGKKTFWIGIFLLVTCFVYFEVGDLDLFISDKIFFSNNKTWPVITSPHAVMLYNVFYNWIKIPIYIIAAITIIGLILTYKKKIFLDYQKGLWIVFLSLVILPGSIAGIFKPITHVHCPYEIQRYGGEIPYMRVIDKVPVNPKSADGGWGRGNCFPSGHASGGFALLSLYCLFQSKRNQWISVFLAMSMGSAMSVFQVLRGMHYLSHCLITFLLAVVLVSGLNLILNKNNKDKFDESSTT